MKGLLRLLREHEWAVEADLQRFFGLDYRDRWRLDERGRPRLTLRRIAVLLLRHPPLEGAVAWLINDQRTPWRREHHQLDDLRLLIWSVFAEKGAKPPIDPDRPTGQRKGRDRNDPERLRKLADARRRAAERRRLIAAGEIT